MRAYMSDLDKRSRWLDYLSTHHTETVRETGLSPEDWVLNEAWGEARAILAETEPEAIAWDTPRFGHHVTLDRMGCSAYYALAEALAGFIGKEV